MVRSPRSGSGARPLETILRVGSKDQRLMLVPLANMELPKRLVIGLGSIRACSLWGENH